MYRQKNYFKFPTQELFLESDVLKVCLQGKESAYSDYKSGNNGGYKCVEK